MRKRKFSVFTAILTLFMQLVFIIQPASVLAETGEDITGTSKFQITNVEIKKDNNDTELGEDVKKDSAIFIKYSWMIPNSEDVNPGDYYTLQLPKEIKIVAPINKEINAADGKVADMNINTNGLVKLTFTNFANNYSNVAGNFYVNCHFKADEIGTNNPVEIIFNIPGKSEPVRVNIDFEQPNPSIQKSVEYNKATDEITWKIVVNKENVNVADASIEDTIEAGQKFISNSVTINGQPASNTNYNYDEATRKFTYNLGDITKQQTITFKTSIHDDLATKDQGDYTYSNKATLNYKDDGTPKSVTSNNASVTVPINLIKKSGEYKGNTNKKIDWTITVNESGRTINNATIKDTLPKGLKLVEGSLKVNGNTLQTNQYQYQFVDYQTDSILDINLGNITDKKVITFTTDVDINVYNSNNPVGYNNKAVLSGEGVKEGTSSNNGVGFTPNIIQKNGAGYDAATGIITWQVIVNSNETNVGAGAVVTDNIEANQSYLEGSATIDDGSNGSFINLSSSQVVYKFNNAFNKKYVITFKTQVINPTHYRANHSENYKNIVNLTAPNINQNTTGYQRVDSEIIRKEGVSYNYATREVTWKIVVNRNKMPITNAVVTDAIPNGHDYVAGSATIDDSTAGFFNSDSNIESTRILKYTFNGTINKTYTITFKTKIIDLSIFNTSGNRTVENTASITGNEIPTNGDNDSKGSKTISNEIVSKTSSYTNGNAYIDWTVKSNPNWNVPMSGATITDILQDGLSLDTDTVELYKASVNSDGTLVQGEKVTLTGENVKYDINTRKFDFTFPQNSGSGAFILKFRTNVSKTGNYTNTVNFKATGVSDEDGTTQNGVWFSDGGGSATGDTTGIKIVKTDADSKPLSGAVFQLIDQYGSVKAISEPTKADGAVLFDKLKYERNYSIREITAPTGYTLNSNIYTFQIKNGLNQGTSYDSVDGVLKFSSSDNSKKVVTYNYKDEILRGNIQLHKAGIEEDIEGAVFQLYKEDGITPVKDSDGNNIISTSKKDGIVLFTNIPYGKYKIKEISVPAPYSIYKGDISVDLTSLTANGQVIYANPYNVYNSKIKGSLKIIKTDENTGQPIQGVKIALYDNEKEQKGNSKVTGEDGSVQFDNLEYGDYYYKEISAPDNYVLDDNYHAFKIESDSTALAPQLINFTNKKVKGDIEFTKVGEDSDSSKLKGAVFGLYQNDGVTPVKSSNEEAITSTSGDDGKVQFKNIEYGTYKIIEINAPTGYKLSTEVLTAVIGKDDNGKTVKPESGDKVKNIKIRGNIEFTKKGDLLDKEALKGAEFTLYEEDGITPVTNLLGNITSTSDENGKVRFSGIKYGKYKIKETKAPEGYNLSKEVLSANITEDGVTVTPTFASGVAASSLINKIITGGIEISKTDISTSAPVPGATIAIYTKDGTKVVEAVTGEDGKVVFEKLNYGDYYFLETNAPEGYLLNPDKHEFSIKEDGAILKANLSNTMITGGIEISKTDISTSAPVPGATITIYTKTGDKVVEAITGEDGKVKFEKLNYGDYYFVETNAPEGYLLNTDKHEFSIKEDGTILKATLTNTMITGGIEISKTDISTSAPVPGATLTIYTKDGTKVVEAVTDKDGKVKFEKLNYGDYYFLETKAPEGYLLNTNKHEFSIREDGVVLKATLTNTMITGGIEISKSDISTSAPVPGATLTIYTKDGTKVVEAVTGEDGKVKFKKLNYGDYYFLETNAPEGYLLNPDKHEFSIKEDGAVLKANLSNTMITGGIEISKTDISTSAPVPGATITIYTKDGRKVIEGVTDKDGKVKFEKLNYGEYYFVETNAPDGYVLNTDKHEFSIKEDGVILKDSITNTKKVVIDLPQTGGLISLTTLIYIGIFSIVLGFVFIFIRKRKIS
ncbi:SpaA isopeptide-forming pilin-related protein [Clostridium intestinale]|uniref:SpaA isopeptide-forming pilin-related protein n=1 Tax=Clostridium intestinale TaxID=36845 RepID=UPI002DD623B1|nr:SpaA isopeptide-forming pilin-related protein [Clostridium intestinale]WRY50534.1 SpaA isopeptide-forming pilin-related protein [Clostridium intestinale]